MSKLAAVFGSNYQSQKHNLVIRKFVINGVEFSVRIPLANDLSKIYDRISDINETKVKAIFEELSAPLLKFKDAESEELQFVDDDVLVQGRSMREAARTKCMTENKIVEFIKLLVPVEEGASMDDITYDDIAAEWPMSVQLLMVEKISEVIAPTYKESRGN